MKQLAGEVVQTTTGSPMELTATSSSGPVDGFRVWALGSRLEKAWTVVGALLTGLGILGVVLSGGGIFPEPAGRAISVAIAILGATLSYLATKSFESRQQLAQERAVTNLAERARSAPAEPKLAWDLARIKLENYLDRNLRQVSSIYYLVVVVMFFGAALILFGIWKAIQIPGAIAPASLAALAGVIVQIIGGTLMLVYRSTMEQAKDYVVVLERINAVGMSINILEGIKSSDPKLRDTAKVQLAHELLGMYDARPRKNKWPERTRPVT